MNVIFLPEVRQYYDELEQILYDKGYFSYKELSKKYVKELIGDISATLPKRRHKPAPPYFDRYGDDMQYAVFRKNRRTSWYAFFETYLENGKVYYLVRYIANNHTIAQYL